MWQPQSSSQAAVEVYRNAAVKRARLSALWPLATAAHRTLQKVWDIELTYTSVAIEGNSLTLRETAELIEHGITVGGKPLRDHLEAVDHFEAVAWMRDLAAKSVPIDESTVREMHRRIVLRSLPELGGLYSQYPRRIAGSAAVFPNPTKIPALMAEFGEWLRHAEPSPSVSFSAHFRLVAIHPFSDGNGRTARLLMNLILLRAGYPPLAVRPVDRRAYLDALEHASLHGDLSLFEQVLLERLDETLDEYLSMLGTTHV